MFNENWYSKHQVDYMISLYDYVKDIDGLIIEIGCWEGYSTYNLTNKVFPENLECVDHWKGNIHESKVTGKTHITEDILRERNVYDTFINNMNKLTNHNYTIHNMDCFNYLRTLKEKVKFVHIDASHDYYSVKNTLQLLIPLMVDNGIICGDDFYTSNTEELHGGVQRAVKELLPNYRSKDNLFYYQHHITHTNGELYYSSSDEDN